MDSELFTVGGVSSPFSNTTLYKDKFSSKEATAGNVNYQTVRTLQTYRHLGKLLFWALIIYMVQMLVVMIPQMMIFWKEATKDMFSQKKEGLQYLGASTSVTRDDIGWPTKDSLAEAAQRAQNAATDMQSAPSPKVTFVVPREQMSNALSPEEKLLKQQAAGH
jgi:hypothetical protein